jgi:CRISPR-associated protein Cas1
MMSFFYMLVYNLITIRLLSFGFEPSIGFLHQPFRSHNALSSDFMELFRADINAFVFRIFDEKIIENSDFTKKNGVYLRYEGRKKIWGEFKMFTQMLEPKIDSEIANIRSML